MLRWASITLQKRIRGQRARQLYTQLLEERKRSMEEERRQREEEEERERCAGHSGGKIFLREGKGSPYYTNMSGTWFHYTCKHAQSSYSMSFIV